MIITAKKVSEIFGLMEEHYPHPHAQPLGAVYTDLNRLSRQEPETRDPQLLLPALLYTNILKTLDESDAYYGEPLGTSYHPKNEILKTDECLQVQLGEDSRVLWFRDKTQGFLRLDHYAAETEEGSWDVREVYLASSDEVISPYRRKKPPNTIRHSLATLRMKGDPYTWMQLFTCSTIGNITWGIPKTSPSTALVQQPLDRGYYCRSTFNMVGDMLRAKNHVRKLRSSSSTWMRGCLDPLVSYVQGYKRQKGPNSPWALVDVVAPMSFDPKVLQWCANAAGDIPLDLSTILTEQQETFRQSMPLRLPTHEEQEKSLADLACNLDLQPLTTGERDNALNNLLIWLEEQVAA